MKNIIILFLSFGIAGCAAMLVPESNNPNTKIRQATNLLYKLNRPVGAITVLKQAAHLAEKQGDELTRGEAEFSIGEVYKNPGIGWEKLKDRAKALEHHRVALEIYKKEKAFKRAAFVMFNTAGVYTDLKDAKESCKSLRLAKTLYEKKGASAKDGLPPHIDKIFMSSVNNHLKECQ